MRVLILKAALQYRADSFYTRTHLPKGGGAKFALHICLLPLNQGVRQDRMGKRAKWYSKKFELKMLREIEESKKLTSKVYENMVLGVCSVFVEEEIPTKRLKGIG